MGDYIDDGEVGYIIPYDKSIDCIIWFTDLYSLRVFSFNVDGIDCYSIVLKTFKIVVRNEGVMNNTEVQFEYPKRGVVEEVEEDIKERSVCNDCGSDLESHTESECSWLDNGKICGIDYLKMNSKRLAITFNMAMKNSNAWLKSAAKNFSHVNLLNFI
ncbi:hypothetical protein ACTFIT_007510 [Dictyostelium discoideum]